MKTFRLSIYLSRWCKKHNFNYTIRYGEEFLCYPDTNEINYALMVPNYHDAMFAKVFEEEGLNYNCDNFILSFFHEIGHLQTESTWNEEEIERFEQQKERIDADNLKDIWKYYHLGDELKATQWAVDYINEHPQEIEEFWAGAQERIMRIYEQVQRNRVRNLKN